MSFLLPAFVALAATQPDPASPARPAPDIVVTGRGLEVPEGEAVYDIVSIGRERLAFAPSSRLEDVLRDVPGFQLFRRSDARSANPTSQGATLRALGGNAASRALVTLDGVPQADPFGGWIAWPALDPRRLASARVVRGGGSGRAGPGALAGSIELDSETPVRTGARGALAYGSRAGIDGFAALSLPVGRGFLALSAAHAQGDGFIPIVAAQRGPADRPAAYSQTSLSLRGAAPVAAAVELQAHLLLLRDARERGTAFSEIATDGLDASLRLVGRGRWDWSALAYLQSRSFANRFAAVAPGRATVSLASAQDQVPATGSGARVEISPPLRGRVSLRLGADLRAVEGETRERFAVQNDVATRGRRAGGESVTAGLFAEASWRAGPLTLTAGGRLDRWAIAGGFLREEILATGATVTDLGFADRAGWEPTARGGAAWALGARLSVRAAAYLGWRLPTLNELYRPFRVGTDATAANPALAPERLRGAEIGLEWRPGPGARVALTAFDNRLRGAIANVTLGAGPASFPGVGFVAAGGAYRQRQNLRAVVSRGVELDGALQLGRWRLSGGYAYADARVQADGAAAPLAGLRPAQTPRHSAALTLAWSAASGAGGSLGAHFAGAQYEDDLNRQRLPAALTFDAAARWPVAPGLSIEARAENLTDTEVVAAIAADGTRERATPRTIWLGIRFGL